MGALCVLTASADMMIKSNSSDYVLVTAKEMLHLLIRERLEWDQHLWC